ncbi:MAG: UbiA family prenyltransferase, partial [Longimicrobiales bacterium]
MRRAVRDRESAATLPMAGTAPGAAAHAHVRTATAADWIRLLRPRQWVKNTFVLAPLLFSGLVAQPDSVLSAFVAFILFCVLASGIYCWNDVADRVADRAHPIKRERPVAAGVIPVRTAVIAGAVLVTVATGAGWALTPRLGFVLLAYLALNLAYSTHLKSVVILDVFAIAAFFILRLLAGCAAIGVRPSVWLLL